MNLPNKLTILRVFMIPVFIFFLFARFIPNCDYIALGIFILASLTDMLDGQIARRKNLVTNFGKFMDPIADKLLVCCALICLLVMGRISGGMVGGSIVVIVIIAREFIIGGFRTVAADNGVVIAASMWGKVKTTFQMIAICLMIANIEALNIVTIVITWVSVTLTIVSLVDYLVKNKDILKDVDGVSQSASSGAQVAGEASEADNQSEGQ